jgi:hypothetical protein
VFPTLRSATAILSRCSSILYPWAMGGWAGRDEARAAGQGPLGAVMSSEATEGR